VAAYYAGSAVDRNFDLPVERERVSPTGTTILQVGEARLDLLPGQWVGVVGSLEPTLPRFGSALERRRKWQQGVLDQAARMSPHGAPPDWIAQLALAADSFIFSGRCLAVPTANR